MKTVVSFISCVTAVTSILGLAGCGGACHCPSAEAATTPDSVSATPEPEPVAVKEDSAPEKTSAAAEVESSEARASTEALWWNIPYPGRFELPTAAPKLDFIRVKGNRFVNEADEPVIFRGVNIADPDKLQREGHWNRDLFETIKSWGANIVRVPVHPAAWRGLGRDEYFKLLDRAVTWATELDLYLVIEWHSIGNLVTGLFQHPMYETTLQETYEFWRAISFRYQGIPAAAFYEIFNEPTVYNGNLGELSWKEWKAVNEEIISIIYSHDKKVIPLVAGFNWAYNLSPVKKAPIEKEGIGYVSHPYPQKTGEPLEKNWEKDFGFVAKKYPLFATEIGYMRSDAPGAHIPVENDDGTYGKRITDYLRRKGASWTAWCFHPHWPPQLISDWDFTPTESGEHFRSVMQNPKAPSK